MYFQTLLRSLEILGDSERLRLILHAPTYSYQAWVSGSEKLPDRVFLRAVDIVVADKLNRMRSSVSRGQTDGRLQSTGVQILIGRCSARCPVCDGSHFAQTEPHVELTNRTILECSFCKLRLTRGDLIVLASKEAAKESAARVAWMRKRRSATYAGAGLAH